MNFDFESFALKENVNKPLLATENKQPRKLDAYLACGFLNEFMTKKLKQSLFKNTILHVRLLRIGKCVLNLWLPRKPNFIDRIVSAPLEKFHLRIKFPSSKPGIIPLQTTTTTTTTKKYKI